MVEYPKVTLLIARHGNTFDPGETVLRVGKRTDLPLSPSGRQQAVLLGDFFKERYPVIDAIFVSSLKRTQETAAIAYPTIPYVIDPIFDEIDYGDDDGRPETEVMARVGKAALQAWEEACVPVLGWHVFPEEIRQNWLEFIQNLSKQTHKVVLVVTSNGIARFLPKVLGDSSYSPKLRTGAFGIVELTNAWKVTCWDVRPE
ncbi:MAG: histidine phosphatase family protein [Gammaproteobacteria bacterium]|nr:histidine phosphatase family protein [Gammaproteobacteria bacterium]MCD8524387.1 histidine phosphatase family protein [Gammaproteobacteria bacterium]MCD8542933.1 histidine phosphatase family protein [Gammaproteobacteria bacterium]